MIPHLATRTEALRNGGEFGMYSPPPGGEDDDGAFFDRQQLLLMSSVRQVNGADRKSKP